MSSLVEAPIEKVPVNLDEPRVLFVYDGEFDNSNGVSNYIRTIGDYAVQQGCAVEYLVGQSSIDEPGVNSFSKTIPVHANGSRSVIAAHTPRRLISETLERFDPDAVHIQLPLLPSLTGKAVEELKRETTVIGTFHMPMPHGWLRAANMLNARLTKTGMRRFDHFYSVSEAAQAAARKIYGVDSEILPCPIDLGRAAESQQPTEQTNDKTVIAFLGRLVARKGLTTFIESLSLLDPAIQKLLQVQIIGDGKERVSGEQQITSIGLRDNTRFFGTIAEESKRDLLATSDIVACPSKESESFGIVLIEAMAASKPVVLASDVAGYSEVLGQAPKSLVRKSDPVAMAQRIEALITDPAQRQALFETQQEVVKDFDIHRTVGPKLMKAYGFTREKQIGEVV